MPSLIHLPERHVVVDGRRGHYLCFPDVCLSGDRLIAVYNDYDQHVGERRRLLMKTSRDGGRTWSRHRVLPLDPSHCPRLSRLSSGRLLLTDDQGFWLTSRSGGRIWKKLPSNGFGHGIIDRPLELADGSLLTTGHNHRGAFPHPAIRQPPAEQMVYRSDDRGETWRAVGPMATERNLVLCEASMTLLPGGEILALLRENSFVYEPMYGCLSRDGGNTWTDPVPTPLVGHRPTLGALPDGRVLVTYRDVSPNPGTCAWLGSVDELLSGFRVHGSPVERGDISFAREGMRVQAESRPEPGPRWALRPMTDPRYATATLTATVRVDHAEENGCGMRLGCWWRIFPDRIAPENGEPVGLTPGAFHELRLEYAAGMAELFVDGKKRAQADCEPDHADTRPVLFGAPPPTKDHQRANGVDATWRTVELRIQEPKFQRDFHWTWDAGNGLPGRWVQDRVLRLADSPRTAYGDFGYSGWTALPDGGFVCVYHHADGRERSYRVNRTSRIMATRFSLEDFE